MNDETPRSGSRWEPAPDDQSTVAVADAPPPAGPTDPVAAATPRAPRRGRGRMVTATVAGAALLLIGGAGGFAIGQATASDTGTAGTAGPGRGGYGDFGGGFGGGNRGGGFPGGPGGPGGATPGTGGTGTGTATGTGTGST